MRTELFRQWLSQDGGRSADTIKRCVRHATVRVPGGSLDWAIHKGLCPGEKTLLDLNAAQLYEIRRRSVEVLSNPDRTYLTTCLRFAAEQEAPIAEGLGPMPLSMVAQAIRTVCPKEGEDTRVILLRALLLDPGFRQYPDKDFSPKRDLLPGKEYSVHRAVALGNLKCRRQEVADELRRSLYPLVEEQNIFSATNNAAALPALRYGLSQAAEKLLKRLEKVPGFSTSEERQLLLRMKGWLPNFSMAHTQDDQDLDWYASFTNEELEAHISDVLMRLLELSLTCCGDRFQPMPPISSLSEQDRLYYALLAPFDRLLTIQLSKETGLNSRQMARLLQLGLFRVERVPYSAASRLCSTQATLQQLSDTPALRPDDPSCLKRVWNSPQMCRILLRMLEALEKEPSVYQTLFEKAPELIALLAVAPSEKEEDSRSAQEKNLADLLDGPDALTGLSEATREELQEALTQVRTQETTVRAARLLADILVRCHWTVVAAGASSNSVESLHRLIALYRDRPESVTRALEPLLVTDRTSPRWMDDWERRTQRQDGDSLLLAELYGRCAGDALDLARDTSLPDRERCHWADIARSDARAGAQMAQRREEYLHAFDFRLLQAQALALRCVLAAQTGTEGSELFADFLLPCAEAVLACWDILEDKLPGQREEVLAEGRSFPETLIDLRRKALEDSVLSFRTQLFSGDVGAALERNKDLWAAIPRGCVSREDWVRLSGIRLHVPSDDSDGEADDDQDNDRDEVAEPPIPTLWLSMPQRAKVFLPYYCAYLDSETIARKQYQQSWVEAYLLKTLLSMENVLLTTNQVADNPIVRPLARQPGFRRVLRSGHVSVSFFRTFFSLRHYAANRMAKKGVIWCSFPPEFNEDWESRRLASAYLSDRCSVDQLPQAYRELLIQFNEDLLLWDENLPVRCKAGFYQTPRPEGVALTLADRLDQFYVFRQNDPLFEDMCRLHFLLLRPGLPPENRKKLIRSLYKACLDALYVGSLTFPAGMSDLCNPKISQKGSDERRYLESFARDEKKRKDLELMQAILSDTQNRMLGSLCTDHQHHLYSQSERLILPYDETNPINSGGCRIFQDTVSTTETGVRLGWEQAPELLERSEAIVRESPNITPETLANRLAGSELNYTLSRDGNALWLPSVTLRTSRNQDLLVEMSDSDGTIHLETEGL